MINLHFFSTAIDDQKRRQILFDGDLIVFKKIKAIEDLCQFTQTLSAKKFHPYFPVEANHYFEKKQYLKMVHSLQREFTNHPVVKELFYKALADLGVDPSRTYCDWFPLRIQPGNPQLKTSDTVGLHAHRDSWYANLMCQTNWWLPIYSIEESQSLAFYPKYWTQPIKNSSKGWNLQAFRQARKEVRERNGSFDELLSAYPYIQLQEAVDLDDELCFVIEPGDVLCFSLAHLHASKKNISNTVRFSTELRTIQIDDLIQGRGPKNIDVESTGNSLEDFYCMQDEVSLIERIEGVEIV